LSESDEEDAWSSTPEETLLRSFMARQRGLICMFSKSMRVLSRIEAFLACIYECERCPMGWDTPIEPCFWGVGLFYAA